MANHILGRILMSFNCRFVAHWPANLSQNGFLVGEALELLSISHTKLILCKQWLQYCFPPQYERYIGYADMAYYLLLF